MIQKAINIIWFQDQDPIGIVFGNYFSPMPIPAIALALTAVRVDTTRVCTLDADGVSNIYQIECCISEWSEGTRRISNWDEARYRTTYRSHIASLNDFGRHVREQGQLELIQHELLEAAR
jgi:hypothetical protein